MVVSGAEKHAKKIVRICRLLIETVSILQPLIPGRDMKDGELAFDVGLRDQTKAGKEPSVAAYGIGGQITGSHVDHIIPDDIETPENSLTVDLRDKLIERTREFEDMLNPGGSLTYLGTPQTDQSIYFYWANYYEMIRIPSEYPENQEYLAPWLIEDLREGRAKPGDPVDPDRFNIEEIVDRRAKSGESRYALQYLLDPGRANADLYPLKLADFIVYPVALDIGPKKILWQNKKPMDGLPLVGRNKDQFYQPGFVSEEFDNFSTTTMTIDPAGHGSDEVGYAVGKELNGYCHVCVTGGLEGGHSEQTLTTLALIAKEYGVKRILVEKNFGDGMYASLLRPVVTRICGKVSVEDHPTWGKGQKEVRIIDTLEPALNQHRIVIDPRVAKDVTLMKQLVDITRERGCLRHDDRLEALAMLVSSMIDTMQVDVYRILEEQRINRIREAAREFDKKIAGQWGTLGSKGSYSKNPKYNPRKSRKSWINR